MTSVDSIPRFPGESPEYRSARKALLTAEIELRRMVAEVAAQRQRLPRGGEPQDYVFDEMQSGLVTRTRLSELFAEGKPSLIVYSFMYGPEMERPCPACTSLIDGINAYTAQIGQRAGIVVVGKSPIERLTAFAKGRGWHRVRLLSSSSNSYNGDYLAEDADGQQLPACHVFLKRDGRITHHWGAELLYAGLEGHPRHMDQMWPLWNYFDLIPEGRGDFFPNVLDET